MEAMIRKQRKRLLESNKQSAFRVRGRTINPQKITRYIKEHPVQPFDEGIGRNMDGDTSIVGMIPAALALS
jgi:hypothetical protein